MGLSYRAAIGELIYALVTCRPDISYATIKLSQYSINPSACHYIAVKNIFRYLLTTKDQGLTYWRPQLNYLLPDLPLPIPITPQHNWNVNLDSSIHISPLYGFSDSDWAGDRSHCRSVSGIAFILSGAVVLYKTRFQSTIAMSSTEAEFIASADAGKMALYLRSLLSDLGIDQNHATLLYGDNMGAYLIESAGQPTIRTHHMEIKEFAILSWVERDLLNIQHIKTTLNVSDVLTKSTARIIFHRHNDIVMGKINPHYLHKITSCFCFPVTTPLQLYTSNTQQQQLL